jgi:hypothetical protein
MSRAFCYVYLPNNTEVTDVGHFDSTVLLFSPNLVAKLPSKSLNSMVFSKLQIKGIVHAAKECAIGLLHELGTA